MSRLVGWLLTEIDKQTEGRLSDETRRDLVAEVESHLDAAIQARLELGMPLEEAEKEAIVEFGPPKAYIDDILRTHEHAADKPVQRWRWLKGDRATMLTLVAAAIYGTVWLCTGLREIEMKALFYGAIVFTLLFVYFSARSRRIQTFPIALLTVATFFVLNIIQSATWLNLYEHEGHGNLPRRQAEEVISASEASNATFEPMLPTLQRGRDLHQGKLTAEKFAMLSPEDQNLALSIPVALHDQYSTATDFAPVRYSPIPITGVAYQPADSLEAASAAWKSEGTRLYDDVSGTIEASTNEIKAIKAAEAAPIFADFGPNWYENREPLGVALILTTLLNLVSATLGYLVSIFPWTIQRKKRMAR